MIFSEIFPLHHATGSQISPCIMQREGSHIFPLRFAPWRCDSLLYLAVGSFILPLQNVAWSQILPLQNAAGSERKNSR